jgi:iron only hydrogenase large subunit-like protein
LAKKLEAAEDHPDLAILVLTYRELETVFQFFRLPDDPHDVFARFARQEPTTRLYPLSGGLTQSSGLKELLAEDEIAVVSGAANCRKALTEFAVRKRVRLWDLLFCEGGCINGPGIPLALPLAARRARVTAYWERFKAAS